MILHVIESEIPPSALLAFIDPETGLKGAREKLRNTFENAASAMLEERSRQMSSSGGIKASYKTLYGKIADEIVAEAETGKYDLVLMASSRITSPVLLLGSIVRKVLDSTTRPVLVIHK